VDRKDINIKKYWRKSLIFILLISINVAVFSVCYGKMETWEPKNTYALIVGVLDWMDKELTPYTKENRQDRAFEAQLVADGVPEENIVFLEDSEATRDSIISALQNIVKCSHNTLIFYYAGHGIRRGNETFFANYDVNTRQVEKTGFSLTELGRILKGSWKGNRLLLFADCCHSGALASVVKLFEGSDATCAACITSVVASNVSTGRWTFTESLVKAFAGNWVIDTDGDCRLTFYEVDTFIQQEMRFREKQITYAIATKNFNDDFVFRKAEPCSIGKDANGPWKLMEYVECEWHEVWYLAQIIECRENEWKVHYIHYDDSWDEWVDDSRLRKPVGINVQLGDKIEVEWGGKWWKAMVLDIKNYFALIHYDGYGSEWDEWVTNERIRK